VKINKILKKILGKTNKKKLDGTRNLKEIEYEELYKLIKSHANIKLVDVRSPQEFAENRITSAINIPLYNIRRDAVRYLPNKNDTIILYCQSGSRSKKGCAILEELGYTDLYNLKGGMDV